MSTDTNTRPHLTSTGNNNNTLKAHSRLKNHILSYIKVENPQHCIIFYFHELNCFIRFFFNFSFVRRSRMSGSGKLNQREIGREGGREEEQRETSIGM